MKQLLKQLLIVAMFLCSIIIHAQGKTSQSRTIKGVVKSFEGELIPGANIIVKGTKRGTATDFDGNFSLKVLKSDKEIEVSSIGFTTAIVNIKGINTFTVLLKEEANILDEVVVGYAKKERGNLLGAVGTVGALDIESKPMIDASQALAGAIAGVQISQNSGLAGDGGGNIIIRGVGTLSESDPLILVDGVISESLSSINPSDIESYTVLKDAASSSIYGVQAANGVILVTTKKGKKGAKPVFTFETGVAMSTLTKNSKPKMITDPVLYMTLLNEARVNSDLTNAFTPETIELYRTPEFRDRVSTDWYDEILDTGIARDYNVSARGGSDTNSYFLSIGHLNQNGIVLDGSYERTTARINLSSSVSPKLTLGTNLGYTFDKQRTPNGTITDTSLLSVLRAAPLLPAYAGDGIFAIKDAASLNIPQGTSVAANNPLGSFLSNKITNIRNTISGNAFVDWNILEGLKLRSSVYANVSLQNYKHWNGIPTTRNWRYKEILAANPNQSLDGLTLANAKGSLSFLSAEKYTLVNDVVLTYNKNFNGHALKFLAGLSRQNKRWDNLRTGRKNFLSNQVQVLEAGDPTTITNTSGTSKSSLFSQFARMNYNYNGKYLFEANIRRDASSRFGPDNRFGYFPSFSAGWIVSKEKFMEDIEAINLLKFRASWGKLGVQGLPDDFAYLSKIGLETNYVFGDSVYTGAEALNYGNPVLGWETQETTNFGINLGLWNSAITLEADYFIKNSTDVIFQTPLPQESGFTSEYSNLASIKNKGLELALNFNTNIKDFNISGGVNFAKIENEIESINPELGSDTDRVIYSDYNAQIRGGAVEEFYLVKWTGKIFQSQEEVDNLPSQFGAAPGDLIFEDVSGPDGVPDGIIDSNDRQAVGTQYPKITYGGNINFNYKNFSLLASFQGIGEAYSYGAFEYFYPSFQGSNIAQHWTDRWTPERPSQTRPRLWVNDGPNTDLANTFFLLDRSYLRLKSVVFSYDLPSITTEKLGIGGLKLYASGQNLYTWTKYKGFDPEISRTTTKRGGLPQAMTVKFGVKITL